MTPVYVVLEGQTELAFVKSVLAPHLARVKVYATPIVVSTKRERDGRKHRGGGDWGKWRADLRRLCCDGRPEVRITTLFDLYGLPKNFPALSVHSSVGDTRKRCELLEEEMAKVIGDRRFIPYLQRHEFEALVLAGLSVLDSILQDPADRAGLLKLRTDIGSLDPEDVNDGNETAPSKRLERFIPSYNPGDRTKGEGKPFYGELVTIETGLSTLRAKCPRFNAWIAKLETLAEAQP
ncbi:MAG: DUF4276 family protein [Proteobacteria bacterium]|nr:DUF4276 family protein [Pseudomonadota bacterium]